ncbi:YraN family protein [Roseovarius sp.]|jgi:putative endonuclease
MTSDLLGELDVFETDLFGYAAARERDRALPQPSAAIGGDARKDDAAGPATTARRDRGLRSWLAGAAAEKIVALAYDKRGIDLLETRWRGRGGEIDLILRDGPEIVFCEVKAARSTQEAILRLRPAQMRRIHAAASEYLGRVPEGQLAQVRFDLAVVDGTGRADILENAFGHF